MADRLSGSVAFDPGCAPVLGLKRYGEDDVEQCTRFNQSVFDHIKSNHIGTVFLHARWELYVEPGRYGRATPLLTPDQNPAENSRELERLLRATIEELQRSHLMIVLIASVPEAEFDVPALLARNALSKGTPPSLAYSDVMERQSGALRLLSQRR